MPSYAERETVREQELEGLMSTLVILEVKVPSYAERKIVRKQVSALNPPPPYA